VKIEGQNPLAIGNTSGHSNMAPSRQDKPF
jgi:hypothetical protein